MGDDQHQLSHRSSPSKKFCAPMKCEVRHNGAYGNGGGAFVACNGWGIYGLMGGGFMVNGWSIYDLMGGAFMAQMGWAIVIVSCCFVWKYAQKCWSSGEYPFRSSHDHGFSPFELPTCSLLQRGQDHALPKACFYLWSPGYGWLHSTMTIQQLNKMGWG